MHRGVSGVWARTRLAGLPLVEGRGAVKADSHVRRGWLGRGLKSEPAGYWGRRSGVAAWKATSRVRDYIKNGSTRRSSMSGNSSRSGAPGRTGGAIHSSNRGLTSRVCYVEV